jgi:hypothetical protein
MPDIECQNHGVLGFLDGKMIIKRAAGKPKHLKRTISIPSRLVLGSPSS